ncbi:hypothetical protein K7432_014815 [Basidiobolus ranarum]|uniref:C2H2-type domain-containing protein n=1 Tax=Basidiobolus ranarum TaxID=34480 RepID=A0ABR2VPZ0_9FUNG
MKTTTRVTYRRKPIHITCPHCQKSFNRKDNYIRHVRTHSGEYPHRCPHSNCAKGFTRSDSLVRHLSLNHSKVDQTNNFSDSDCRSATFENSHQTVMDDLPKLSCVLSRDTSVMCIHNLVDGSSKTESPMELSFVLNN